MHLVCPQNFAYALFSVSPGKAVIPRRDKKRKSKVTQYFCLGGGAGDDGGKQGVFIMGDVQMANSFILTQETQVEIIDSVTHFKSMVLFQNSK